jgi:hypothetical protein
MSRKAEILPRRSVGISRSVWISIGMIAVKTGRSKSEVVEEALARYAAVEGPKLFGKANQQP